MKQEMTFLSRQKSGKGIAAYRKFKESQSLRCKSFFRKP